MMKIVTILATLVLFCSAVAVAETMAIINSRIIDGTGSPPQAKQTILIDDGFIRDVFSEGERSLPSGVTVTDVGDRIVLPGLINGHVHLNRTRSSLRDAGLEDREAALAALLRSGVTSVRELAGDARLSGELAQRQARGESQGPRIYYSAVMYGPAFLEDPRVRNPQYDMAPGTAPWSRAVTADSNIAEVITEARLAGATGIKLYASLNASLLNALTAEAHRQDMKAWAHSVTFPASPSEVVASGVDSLIHSRGLIAEAHADVPDTFKEGIAWIRQLNFKGTDVQAPRFAQLFAEMKRRGVIFEPALYADGDPAMGPTGDWRDDMREWSCKITNAAHRAGVTISAGTDTPAATGALQRELERLVECGLSPLEAIRAATLNNALALGIANDYGTVESGKVADLLIVNGDPATDISSVSNVHMVVQGGQIIIGPVRLE